MAITTYATLVTALADWSIRDDLTSYLDDFIAQTEAFFKYPPQRPEAPGIGGIRASITRATGTLTAGTATLARPTDFLEPFRFVLTADSGGVVEYVGSESVSLAHRSGSGQPRYYTVNDVIEFDVAPDSAYAYELSYYAGVPALTSLATTNYVITNYPNVYLSGCLFHLNRFIKDEQQAQIWLQQYKEGVYAINKSYQRSRTSQGPIAAKVG